MPTSFFRLGLTALGVWALALTPAPAQVAITWSTPAPVTGPADLVASGTFVAALTAAASNVTFGGVTFASTSSVITTNASRIGYTPGTFASGDGAFNAFINRGYFTGISASRRITLNQLTVGDTYRVQVWMPAWDQDFATQLTGSSNVELGNTRTAPTFATGTFTALNSTEYFDFAGYGGSTRGLIAGVALYNTTAIPEPSTYAVILSVLVLGAVAWRRGRATPCRRR